MVGVSCVLISKLKAAGPQFQLGSFAVGQIEMFFPEEGVTQSDGMISKMESFSRWRHAAGDKLHEAATLKQDSHEMKQRKL